MPDERLGVVVPGFDPVIEVGGDRGHGCVRGSLQQFAGDFREPAFHEVQPAAARGREMEREPLVA